jgi:predicted nuclease with TOPRIM domain
MLDKLIKENKELRQSNKNIKMMYDEKIEHLNTQIRYLSQEVEENRSNNDRLNTLLEIVYSKDSLIKELNKRLGSNDYSLILDAIYEIMNDSVVISFSYDV